MLFSSLVKVTSFKVFWFASPPYLPTVFGTHRTFTESLNLMCSIKKLFGKIWHNSRTVAEKICSAKYRNQAKPDKVQKQPPEVFCKNEFLRNFAKLTVKHLWQSLFLNFIEKETLAQVFSCEFYDISKNTFSYKTPPVVASEDLTPPLA